MLQNDLLRGTSDGAELSLSKGAPKIPSASREPRADAFETGCRFEGSISGELPFMVPYDDISFFVKNLS